MSHGVFPGLVLLAWIPFTLVMFQRFDVAKATAISMFSAVMFLPEHAHYDLPLTPDLDKGNLSNVVLVLILLFQYPRQRNSARLGSGPEAVFVLLPLAHIATWLTNRDPLVYGIAQKTFLPGMGLRDALSGIIWDAFGLLFPFLVGRIAFQSLGDLRRLLHIFAMVGIVYIPMIFFELRFSPQLHTWIYGYPAIVEFLQTLRWGGYRPYVFTRHGIALALIIFGSLMSAGALYRGRLFLLGTKSSVLVWVLFVVMILIKSTGAIVYAVATLPLQLATRVKMQMRVASVIGLIAITYPYLRSQDLVPVDDITEAAMMISEDRAGSLRFRFDNEEILLEKAQERLMFGWGGYGRPRVYSDWDGQDISVTDGYWIIRLGAFGLIGMFVPFFLLVFPVLFSARRTKRFPDSPPLYLLGGLALYVAINALELVPNSLTYSLPLVLAGALFSTSRQSALRGAPMQRRA